MSAPRWLATGAGAALMVATATYVLLSPGPTDRVTFTTRIILGLLFLVSAFFLTRGHGPAASSAALARSWGTLFLGLLSAILMTVHLLTVLLMPFRNLAAFTYSFRFYSLCLLGVAVLVPAIVCLRSVRGLVAADPDARRRAQQATLVILALNLPLVPLQDFALAFAGGALGNALILWLAPEPPEV